MSRDRPGDNTGRLRSERLRHRRNLDGLVQVSGWVPGELRDHARELLAALARSMDRLPLDPASTTDAAMRAELAAAVARAEAAERGWEQARSELVAVQAELLRIRGQGGWRGLLRRLAGSGRL